MDPRVHWTRPRSTEWHANKQAEIKARGGRKANVGMAAQRLVRQRQQAETAGAAPEPSTTATSTNEPRVPSVWVGELPGDVLHNKAWTALMGTFAHDEEKRHKKAKRLAHPYRQKYGA